MEASVAEHARSARGPRPRPSSGPGRPGGRADPRLRWCAGAAGAAVLAQIAYPLLSGPTLTTVTVLTVALFCLAVLAHAAAAYGTAGALRFAAAAAGIGLLAETVGVHSGVPFGRYGYSATLGPAALGVPLVVPAAWTMMTYPTLLLARRLAAVAARPARSAAGTGRRGQRLAVALLGGVTLAAWDLFLDPQLVAAGLWTWQHPDPGLPGVPGVPLTNLAGWLLVGTVLTAVLDRVVPAGSRPGVPEAVPAALLAWTWLGSALANAAFFGRPALAGYGFAALGATVGPYLVLLVRDRHDLARGTGSGIGSTPGADPVGTPWSGSTPGTGPVGTPGGPLPSAPGGAR